MRTPFVRVAFLLVGGLLLVPSACSDEVQSPASTTSSQPTGTTNSDDAASVSTSSTSTTQAVPASTTSEIQASGPWSVVHDHPVVGRTFPSVVWTGDELVVWGGEKPSEGEWHATGAALDPATGKWRDLPASPLAPRSEHVAVWTGEEILICCGRLVGEGTAAGAYNPATDEWRRISAPPINPVFAEAIWTGNEMVVFGGVGPGGVGNLVGAAAYNPETDIWRRLADLPYGLERTADAVLGDGIIYAWPSSFGAIRTPGPLLYDLEADEWNPMPEPPQPAPSTPSLEWTGHVLFAYGAASNTEGQAIGLAVTFDPATQNWAPVPPAPLAPVPYSEGTEASQATTWTGQEVIVWTGWVGTDWEDPITRVAAYDPSTGSWSELEPAPIPAQGLWHAPITWTGNQLIPYTNPMLTYKP